MRAAVARQVTGVWRADVEKIVVSSSAKKQCRKKAALCLLRLVRKYPEGLEDLTDDFKEKLMDLLEDPALGACLVPARTRTRTRPPSPHTPPRAPRTLPPAHQSCPELAFRGRCCLRCVVTGRGVRQGW
jgi:hypothetical protein